MTQTEMSGNKIHVIFPSEDHKIRFKIATAKRKKTMTGAIMAFIRKEYPEVFKGK